MDLKNILTVIKMRRQELKKSQDEVGALLGIKKSSYGKKENGVTPFTMDELKVVCGYLGLDFEDIGSRLPMQTKTAPVASSEYIKLTNQLIQIQNEMIALRAQTDLLRQENAALKNELAGVGFRKKTDIFGFFEHQIVRMHEAYGPDYKVDWTELAKAAKLQDADKFLYHYGQFKAEETSAFLQPNADRQDHVAFAADRIRKAAIEAGLSPLELLKLELEKEKTTGLQSHAPVSRVGNKA